MRRNSRNIYPFRKRSRWTRTAAYAAPTRKRRTRRRLGISPIMVMLPLAAFMAVFLWDGVPPGLSLTASRPVATSQDRESARFSRCIGPIRYSCVVDGDTLWYKGTKIRIADINTPEVSEPGCAREAELGAKATARLVTLLNEGPFSLERIDRDTDKYGRALRVVTRGGRSLGGQLVREGYAERWKGYRREWC
ncbi:MAG: thermonuclease family protein [Novosphingobium sp.]